MRYLLFVLMFFCCVVNGQQKIAFAGLTEEERNFESFEKNPDASAVYLYEKGNNYFEVRANFIWLITEYHAKIKILKEDGLQKANIEIPYYFSDDRSEKVHKIKAVTHNNGLRNSVKEEDIYTVDESEHWKEKRFTFPNVKVGSVLEYTYEVQSPFFFNLKGWDFQSDIPKVYSEYYAKIPGNWKYNRTLVGTLELDVNDASIEKKCFTIPRAGEYTSCEVLQYAMKNVPSFDGTEAYMLSPNNYRSALEFELSEYQKFYGGIEKYTKTWKDVDREFKKDQDIGRQLRKKNFLEKNVPATLLEQGTELERAKNIYAFVQNHFTWNKKYNLWNGNRVKKAFDEKKGSVAEINIALINLLNAAGIKTDMMVSATRNRGLPKRNHPVLTDFNYILAKTTIGDKDYLLDATDKDIPFGLLPYKCLNYYGRVMDFDNESYWKDIVPYTNNKKMVRVQMALDTENGMAKGKFDIVSNGYYGLSQIKIIKSKSEEEYLEELENDFGSDFYITSYETKQKFKKKKQLREVFDFEIENLVQEGNIYINPFVIKFFNKNPFTSNERYYPIDFGHTINNKFFLKLQMPEGYRLKTLPETKMIGLPNNLGTLTFKTEAVNGSIDVLYDFQINALQFDSKAYPLIKKFFSEAVDVQTKSLIVLEKI